MQKCYKHVKTTFICCINYFLCCCNEIPWAKAACRRVCFGLRFQRARCLKMGKARQQEQEPEKSHLKCMQEAERERWKGEEAVNSQSPPCMT